LLGLDIPVQFIQGNGDREVLAQMEGTETDWYRTAPEQWREPVRWTAQQLHPEHEGLLAGWPKTLAGVHLSVCDAPWSAQSAIPVSVGG
jgi:hypothetical protein